MAAPTPYELSYDFTAFQVANPTTPLPADKIEIEFNNIQETTDDLITNLGVIQRADGALNNGIVTFDSLSATTKALLGTTMVPKGDWATTTSYAVMDLVTESGSTYICAVAHTSGTFATDLAAGKWMVWSYIGSGDVVLGPASATDGDIARFDGTTGKLIKAGLAVGTGANNIVQLDGSGDFPSALSVVIGPASATDGHVAQFDGTTGRLVKDGLAVGTSANNLVQLDADGKLPAVDGSALTGLSLLPAGVVVPYAGSIAPAGWLLCYGQAVSRTTYASLFSLISTTYGSGDGSTTFNLPDLRGRVVAGKDNMGGTSANRLTGLTGGVDGDVLGATGGTETHTLTTTQMPAHAHSIYGQDPGAIANGFALTVGSRGGTAAVTADAGGGAAHNNVQPVIVLNYIIKYTASVGSSEDGGGSIAPRLITSGASATFAPGDVFIGFKSATTSAKTLTLGAAIDVQTLVVKDVQGTAETYPITINGSGCTIDGGASYIIDNNNGSISMKWDGTSDWMVF